jgi:predicted nucleotidyltransferase
MRDEEFEALPYGSEGLWRKLMHAARQEATLEDVIAATKSKRYTRTRIDRMILCAFLGITEQALAFPAPYVRILALNDRGRQILKSARANGCFVNIGEKQNEPYQLLEDRCSSLYTLFSSQPERPDSENAYRVYYQK